MTVAPAKSATDGWGGSGCLSSGPCLTRQLHSPFASALPESSGDARAICWLEPVESP